MKALAIMVLVEAIAPSTEFYIEMIIAFSWVLGGAYYDMHIRLIPRGK